MSETWALRPSQEDARVASDVQLLQQDYQLLIMVHGEAIKQVGTPPVQANGNMPI